MVIFIDITENERVQEKYPLQIENTTNTVR